MTPLRTSEPRLRRTIDALAVLYVLPRFLYYREDYSGPELLEAIVLTESSGDPKARRYEPHQDRAGRKDAASDADRPGVDDAGAEDDVSRGLCQVMGYGWRRIVGAPPGTPLRFDILYDPVFALRAGIEVLQGEMAALYRENPSMPEADRVVRALARYNGGPTGDDIDPFTGDIRLRGYVDKVAARAVIVRTDRHAQGWVVA